MGRSYAARPLRRPSWRPLAAALGLSWSLLGPSWGLFGPYWGPLLAVSGPSWAVLGPPWEPLGPYWGFLGGCLGRPGPLGAEKGENAKIFQKPIGNLRFWLLEALFRVLLGPSWAVLGASRALLGPSGAVLGPFGAILRPSWSPKRPKRPNLLIFHRFL